MKKFKVLLILSALSVIPNAYSVPIDDDSIINSELKKDPELLDALANVIELSGYSCSSISGAHPFLMSYGFTVTCNNFTYTYEIEDKGGNWVVTVK